MKKKYRFSFNLISKYIVLTYSDDAIPLLHVADAGGRISYSFFFFFYLTEYASLNKL